MGHDRENWRDHAHRPWLSDKKLSFSGYNDTLLASGDKDCSIKIWGLLEKKEKFTLKINDCYSSVTSVSFSSDGLFLESGYYDNLIKIWNLDEKKEECTLIGSNCPITSVSFSPDGKY